MSKRVAVAQSKLFKSGRRARTLSISDEHYQALRDLGNGWACEGIAKLIYDYVRVQRMSQALADLPIGEVK